MKNTSIYNKIREILSVCANSNHENKLNILAELIFEKPEFFVYYKKNESGQVKEFPCNPSTIRQKIRFCISLGLIDSEENCSLTDEGRIAQDMDRFDYVLQQRILVYFEKKSIPWEIINDAIDQLQLPSPINLYKYIKPNLSYETFRTCMFLLSICGESMDENILKHYQQKLYLTQKRFNSAIKS